MLNDMATANNSYIQDSSGTYIPATQRPDGSWRKARRVKDGYIPQEEMPLYESKGKQWAKNRATYPVGLDPKYVIPDSNTPRTIPGLTLSVPAKDENAPTKSSKKKKKKKSESPKVESVSEDIEKLNISGSEKTNSAIPEDPKQPKPQQQQPATDPTKRLRNLKKKIRDINALKQKIDSGELPNPDKDQLEKIARKEMIEAEIEDLELELAVL